MLNPDNDNSPQSTYACPEMGKQPTTDKLFHVQFNFRSSYSLSWLESRDAEAREVLKRLRVKALRCSPFRVEQTGPGKSSYGMWPGQNVVTGLISSGSEDKVMDSGLACYESLLD